MQVKKTIIMQEINGIQREMKHQIKEIEEIVKKC